MSKKTSTEIENKIIELSNKQYNKKQVARMVGVTDKVVTRIAKEKGLKFAIPYNARTSPEIEKQVLDMFLYGHNTTHISKHFNLTTLKVNRILKRNGIDKIPKNMLNLTVDDKKEICELYEKGFSTVDIANIFNDKVKADKTISNILKENGIRVGTAGSSAIILNENFFEKIDTEQKAYYLGFIYADGNIRKDIRGNYIFQMELQSADVYILEQIIEALQCKKKIKDFKNKEVHCIPKPINSISRTGGFKDERYCNRVSHTNSIRVISIKVYSDLLNNGLEENKTFSLSFPHWMPKHLLNHFIRGYFDGDGSAIGGVYPKFVFYGQPGFLASVHEILIKELQVNDVNIFNKESVSMLTYGSKKDVKNIYHYFYDNANCYLIRKKDKISPYINTEVTRRNTNV